MDSEAARMISEFHRHVGHPGEMNAIRLRNLRAKLIQEEAAEAGDELRVVGLGTISLPRLAKELADLLVVTYGTAEVYEIPLDRVLVAVHESNMTKTADHMRDDGKVMKGPNYIPPDLSWI